MVSVEQAINDINAKGGVSGKKIKLIWEDSQTDFAKSAEAAEKVIEEGAQVLLVDCDFRLFGFQRGVMVASSDQLGLPA